MTPSNCVRCVHDRRYPVKMSIRELRAQVAAAIAATERGELVTITKHGKPVALLGPLRDFEPEASEAEPSDAEVDAYWNRLMEIRRKLGLDKHDGEGTLDEEWRKRFDDPAFSRAVLGLDDDWEPWRPDHK